MQEEEKVYVKKILEVDWPRMAMMMMILMMVLMTIGVKQQQ